MYRELDVTVSINSGAPMSRQQRKRYQLAVDDFATQMLDDLRPVIVDDIRAMLEQDVASRV